MGMADRFYARGETAPAICSSQCGIWGMTSNKWETADENTSHSPLEFEGRTQGRGFEVPMRWPVAGSVCTSGTSYGALDWGEG